MIKFINGVSRVILFIMNVYIYIHNSVKGKDFNTIVKYVVDSIKNIFLFVKNVGLDLTFSINVQKYSNNDFIVFIRDNDIYLFDLRNFNYGVKQIKSGNVFNSNEELEIIYCDINCHPYIFLDDSSYIYITSVSGETRALSKWIVRGITTDDVILDSINIEENKLKIKEIVKCSECYYNLIFNDGESFIILLDPINETYSCYNSKYTMEELHQASKDDNEEIIYRF